MTDEQPGEAAEACEHDKCFASFLLASMPPQRPWVCRRCGVKGSDRVGVYIDDEYERLTKTP